MKLRNKILLTVILTGSIPVALMGVGLFYSIQTGYDLNNLKNVLELEVTGVILAAIVSLVAFVISWIVSNRLENTLLGISETFGGKSVDLNELSEKINANIKRLEASGTYNASAVQETVSSMHEITAMIQKNADSAKSSISSSEDAKNTAIKGKESLDSVINALSGINTTTGEINAVVDANNEDLSSIVDIINEINDKTVVINDIVFQTKLLSFNASVEAARAGEHGKGFAVVAEEIGSLAEMSGKASKEIAELLNNSVDKVNSIVTTSKTKINGILEQGKERVSEGQELAHECQTVFDNVIVKVDSVNHMVNEIAIACEEQANGAKEASLAMAEIENSIQESSSISKDVSGTTDDLFRLSAEMSKASKSFRDYVSQGQSVNTPAPASVPKIFSVKNEEGSKKPSLEIVKNEPVKKPESPKKTVVSIKKPVVPNTPIQKTDNKKVIPLESKSEPKKEIKEPKITSGDCLMVSGSDLTVPKNNDDFFEDF